MSPVPDYEIADRVEATTPSQLKAVGHRTRARILDLVLERAATTTELAAALGMPKGTVGYHVKTLEEAGLIKVVATKQVRALTAHYYGRVGRTIIIKGDYLGAGSPAPMLTEALREAGDADAAGLWSADDPSLTFTMRHVRLSGDAASMFAQRLQDLAAEFSALPRSGDIVYGLIVGLYPTDHPTLDPTDENA